MSTTNQPATTTNMSQAKKKLANNKTMSEINEMVEKLEQVGITIFRGETGQVYSKTPRGVTVFDIDKVPSIAEQARWEFKQREIEFNPSDLNESLRFLYNSAQDAEQEPVFVRVGEKDGLRYIDLCDTKHQVVRISKTEWDVIPISACPVHFLRPPGALPLPVPEHGGSIDQIRKMLGITDDGVWLLALGWLLTTLNPHGSHPILALDGAPGSGKTTLSKNLARLIDPRKPQVPMMQYKSDDLRVAARSRWVLVFDDVNGLTADKCATLCNIVCPDSGIETRKNYTDYEVNSISLNRPVILNSNNNLLIEPRVLERSFPITLAPINASARRTDTQIDSDFAATWSKNLGALFDLVVGGLRFEGLACPPEDKIRMADAGEEVERCLQSAGWGKGEFVRAVKAAQQEVAGDVIDEWPLLAPLEVLAQRGFKGTSTELHHELTSLARSAATRFGWPKATELKRELKQHEEALLRRGIVFCESRTGKARLIELKNATPASQPTVILPPAKLEAMRVEYTKAHETFSDRICIFQEAGCAILFGEDAEKAATLLARSVEPGPMIRLSQDELDRVNNHIDKKWLVCEV